MDLIVYKKDTPIQGEVKISGSKNSAVAIIPASLLSSETVVINNIPDIDDVRNIIDIINELGHFISFSNNTVIIKRNSEANYVFSDKVGKLRGSYYFISVYLAYFGKIAFKSCGGCDLGGRPTNYHYDGFKALGVNYKASENMNIYYHNGLKGTKIKLPKPSVGATINIMILATNAFGKTVISNASLEPEVIDIGNFLISMNANITGLGTSEITIHGKTIYKETNYTIIPDRIEAGTYLALGALSKGSSVTVNNVSPLSLQTFLDCLKKMGHHLEISENSITASCGENLLPLNVSTSPFPGMPTDLGPIISVLLLQIEGESIFEEGIFVNRFSHIPELIKLGADIEVFKKHNKLLIRGGKKLHGDLIEAHDLRCAAALVIASLTTRETVYIKNIDYLFRGYESVIKKLQNLNIFCSIV